MKNIYIKATVPDDTEIIDLNIQYSNGWHDNVICEVIDLPDLLKKAFDAGYNLKTYDVMILFGADVEKEPDFLEWMKLNAPSPLEGGEG